jgi:DNA-directed RNA polymerase beta' subunit
MLPSSVPYTSEIKTISRIDFSLLSSDEVRRSAIVTVTSARLVQSIPNPGSANSGQSQSTALFGTLYDPRFGTIERNSKCVQCGLSETECPGHRGVILLDEPIYYPPTIASSEMLKVLRTLCFVCRDVLIDDNWVHLYKLNEQHGLRRWNSISVMLKENPIRCRKCQTPQLDFRIEEYRVFAYAQEKRFRVVVPRKIRAKPGTIAPSTPALSDVVHETSSFKQEVSARQILEMFGVENSTDDHMVAVDTKRAQAWQALTGCPESPLNMIMTAVGVLELRHRPYIVMNNGITHDDLTFKYTEIVKTNEKIRKALGKPPNGVRSSTPSTPMSGKTDSSSVSPDPVQSHHTRDLLRDLTAQLFGHVRTLYHNKNRQSKNPHTQTPTKDVQKRLDTKTGRVRGNLSGKRVNFSSRAPISPDSMLDADIVRMSPVIAKVLTFPMHVTTQNMARANELMEQGKVNTVIRAVPVQNHLNESNLSNPLPPPPKWFDIQAIRRPRYTKVVSSITVQIGDVIQSRSSAGVTSTRTLSDVQSYVFNPLTDRIIRNREILYPVDLVPPREEKSKWLNAPPGTTFYSNELRCSVRRETTRSFQLKVGDIIERQYESGMSIYFNRQPTLHIGSMLERKVVIDENDPWMTFRFNLSGTDSFNADMDGDEMSAWVPQSFASVAELVECAGTEAVVKTSEDGRLLQVLKQDALTGGYLLTVGHAHGRPLGRVDFYQCTMLLMDRWKKESGLKWIHHRLIEYGRQVLHYDAQEFNHEQISFADMPEEIFTGHALLSLLFPMTFSFELSSESTPKLIIKNGLVHSGVFNKAVLSEHRGSMLHLYDSLYGARAVIDWISAYQILVVQRLGQFGFSVGMKDTELVGAEVESVIEQDTRKSWIEAREAWILNDKMSEVRVSTSLNNIKALGQKVTKQFLIQDTQSNNGIITAIASGAKGSFANVASMTVMVGQQNLEGKRMPMIFGGELGARTLPCYLGEDMYRERINEADCIFDRVLESRGRVMSPYRKGLTPQEYFFCAMAGREGMIDTVGSAYTHTVHEQWMV